MSQFICHDFKTPRTDMSRRLPNSMRIVPVVFYIVLGLSAYIGFNDYRGYSTSEKDRQEALAHKDELAAAKAKLDEEKAKIQSERARGEAYAKWLEGARVMQPVSVAIARAMPPETNITELSMERSPDLPDQVSLLVRMMNGTLAEVGKIEAALTRLHYRSHSPGQAKQGDQVEFRSMITWQE